MVEPAQELPIAAQVDLLVLGGSCTGVFAAVRAARLGLTVAIVEQSGCFGGTAALALVNVWHSLWDTKEEQQIIGGLTAEVQSRLEKRGACVVEKGNPCAGAHLNVEELKIELDAMILSEKIRPFLHTQFCAPLTENGKITAAIIQNKSGRTAICARFFIDATGDGDLCYRLGLSTRVEAVRQPPTMGANIQGFLPNHMGMPSFGGTDLNQAIRQWGKEYHLPEGWGWCGAIPQTDDVTFSAVTRIVGVDCCDAEQLTLAEMEGRRQVRAVMDIAKKAAPQCRPPVLLNLSAGLGVRETRHVRAFYTLKSEDILYGRRFDDAIANGSYRVDIHNDDRPGLTFRYLDGTEVYSRIGYPLEKKRWRKDDGPYPTFYQIPYRCLIPGVWENLLCCGRMLDADREAFGAVRVMVCCNQMGEAAGVAAALAVQTGLPAWKVPISELRERLVQGGSIIL